MSDTVKLYNELLEDYAALEAETRWAMETIAARNIYHPSTYRAQAWLAAHPAKEQEKQPQEARMSDATRYDCRDVSEHPGGAYIWHSDYTRLHHAATEAAKALAMVMRCYSPGAEVYHFTAQSLTDTKVREALAALAKEGIQP